MRYAALLTLLLCSCSASLESAKPPRTPRPEPDEGVVETMIDVPDRCPDLDDRRVIWGAVGKGATVLGGGAGLATIPVDDKNARIALATGTALMATVAAVAIYVQEGADESWVRECSQK
jgi:hypothetical protein